ncbi:MAG: OmpA family protein [Alphaproteobacteria bacterium]|nr:OmpA family protein [Alphaproteobacteria bacterium]
MITAILLSGVALAQDVSTNGEVPTLNAQLFRPSIDSFSNLWVDDATRAPNKYTTARAMFNYSNDLLVYTNSLDERTELVSNLLEFDIMAAHTRGRFRFGAFVPVYLRSTGDATSGETGLGDVAVEVKASVLDPNDKPLGLAVSGRLITPTATVDAPLGHGGLAYEVGLIAAKRFGPVSLAANVGTRGVPEALMENVEWDDQLYARLGGGFAVSDDAGVSLDVAGHFAYADIANAAAIPIEALLGGYGRLGDSNFVMRGGVGTGITSGVGAPKFRALFALAYEPPRTGDSDKDGILDFEDDCPDVPEDMDSYLDEDGCPEPTVVSFRVVDDQNKPISAAKVTAGEFSGAHGGQSEFAAGSYDLAIEAEGYDSLTASFDVVEGPPIEVVQTLKFVPGTLVVIVQTESGEPVPGAQWALNGESKGAAEGPVELAQRPGPYTVTAEAPGFLRGSQKTQLKAGERSEITIVLEPSTVKVDKEKIDLGDSVYFETNKAIIKPASYGLLDDVAKVMKEYPEIKLVRIEGHTDSRGDAAYNQQLSEDRANAVRTYLIDKGVEAGRLEAAGFGESKPLDPAETPAAWEKNRRVDFFIKERSDG